LSKNLLYAPLTAYHKAAAATCVDDKDGIDGRLNYHKKKSFKESSLVSFLHSVSCDYHRTRRSTVNDAKNNGSRPLGLADIEDRIRQRAVTLIGGGINSSIIPITIQRKLNKKRHQKSSEEMEPILKKKKLLSSLPSSSSSSSSQMTGMTTTLDGGNHGGSGNNNNDEIIPFLQGLNIAWNAYIWKVIALNKIYPSSHKKQNLLFEDNTNDKFLQYLPSLKEIEYKLIALTRINKNNNNRNSSNNNNNNNYRPLELIGSHVRIESCNSRRSWIGRFGILIGETTNTYRIAGSTTNKSRRNRKIKRDQTKELFTSSICASDSVKNEDEASMSDVEVFLLPKHGSSLVVIIPIPDPFDCTDGSSSCVHNKMNKDDHDSLGCYKDENTNRLDNKGIIHLPDRAICFSIVDPDNIK